MAKHDAVDRMMAMATEKRADRVAENAVNVVEALPPRTTAATGVGREIATVLTADPPPRPPGADRGRQILQAVRPLLPALAGALRLVDHGAVQAVARLLPLLGGGGAAAMQAGLQQERAQQEQDARELLAVHTAQQALRKDVQALQLESAEHQDESRRLRGQVERLTAEEAGRVEEVSTLADRVRLLTASTIILLMLVVAQMILLVVIFHR